MSDSKRRSIARKYATIAKKIKRDVKLEDLKESGITKDMVTHHYGSIANLDRFARSAHPDKFFDVSVEHLYSPKAIKALRDGVKKHNRFVVTTAVNGCEANAGFLASLKSYCKHKDAALLILISSDPAANSGSGKRWGTVCSSLQGETIVFEDTRLNDNVFLSTIKLSAKHIDPITGLSRVGQRNGTFIYASPKQRLKAVPMGNGKLPHFMMTTGAITKPNYNTDIYMSQRTAYIADHDHVVGAVVVEIVDDEFYHFRQVQATDGGSFCDMGIKYSPDGTTVEVRPEALILGDWHAGSTDPQAKAAWIDAAQKTKPKRIILHDAFDGISINHHEEGQNLLKVQRSENGQLDLELEMQTLAADLKMLGNLTEEIVVVKSNHDLFLERYLQQGKYVQDPENHKIALQLSLAKLNGEDPLAYGVGMSFDPSSKEWHKIRWLSEDDDFSIEGVQLGAHGHRGANGAKGSLRAMEAAYANSVSGHAHTPEILRGAWQVGTSSILKLEYNKGASSWLHSSCLLYPGGHRQLINCIEGQWYLKK
jgi:hypothetical protein